MIIVSRKSHFCFLISGIHRLEIPGALAQKKSGLPLLFLLALLGQKEEEEMATLRISGLGISNLWHRLFEPVVILGSLEPCLDNKMVIAWLP